MAENEIRVLHIDSQKEWRGGQQQAVNLYEALRAKGYQTMFACSSNSKLKSYFVERKFPFFEVAMFGEIDFISAFKISIYCRKNNYNVLCLHSAGAHSIGLMAKIFYPKLVIIGIRRVDFKIKSNFLSQKKYKSSLVNSIVCISNEIKRVMLECGISEDKLKVIHSGININKFSNDKPEPRLKQEINIPDNEIVIGTIAALEGHKDYPNLLNAAKKVLEKRNNVTFVAVGEGKKRDELIELHKELDLGKKFKFVGYQSNVSKYLFLFDVFVLASKTEGLGTSILDAQSIGLPVVATNVGGIPEAVQNNYNGILVEAQNANELAEAIIKLADNKELRKQLGLKGRESVKNFDTQLTTEKYLELFRTLR